MKTLQIITTILLVSFISLETVAQCSINFCPGGATLTADAPTFNANNGSIFVDNIVIGDFGCAANNYRTGLELYVYQLMPNGNRVFQCNVQNPSPDNTIGNISIDFGQTNLCGTSFNIGSITADSANGFEACDGARYEIEAVLFVTDDLSLTVGNQTVFSQLSATEYTVLNLGTIDANITGTFPGNGQPLTTSSITEFNTGSSNTITVDCTTDVELYVEGLSRLSSCVPYNDLSTGIPSELENEFSFTVNGGASTIIQNSATGAAGGQLQGPDPALGGFCYSGILTDNTPYVFAASNVANVCDGATVVITLSTTDLFTNQTVTDQFTIIYEPLNCVNVLTVNANNIASGSYSANQIVNSAGRVLNGSDVEMNASNCINLNNNFEVKANADYHAFIGPCQ